MRKAIDFELEWTVAQENSEGFFDVGDKVSNHFKYMRELESKVSSCKMNNKEVSEQLHQSHNTSIAELVWIAGSINQYVLSDILQDIINANRWERLFPTVPLEIAEKEPRSSRPELLVEINKLGFLAEIHIPKVTRFHFDENGVPISWSANPGHSRIEYVYSETLESLILDIKKQASETFKDYVKAAISKASGS